VNLLAYGFYGGGACPSQFFWHNIDKSKWYYFRYRNGHWTLRESNQDIDEGNGYETSQIIAEGYEGDSLDGFCTKDTMSKWLKKQKINLLLGGKEMNNETLKVSSKSNPNNVAGAIAGIITEKGKVELQAIGAGAINQTVKAIAIARGYLAPLGVDLVCIPAFATVSVEDQDKTGMKFIVKGAK